jgi:hypothetical protein
MPCADPAQVTVSAAFAACNNWRSAILHPFKAQHQIRRFILVRKCSGVGVGRLGYAFWRCDAGRLDGQSVTAPTFFS